MAIKDISKKPFVEDRDDNVFIGIDLQFRNLMELRDGLLRQQQQLKLLKII